MKCEVCKGSGWNQEIPKAGLEIIAPVMNLPVLKKYVESRLLCAKCSGSGKVADQ